MANPSGPAGPSITHRSGLLHKHKHAADEAQSALESSLDNASALAAEAAGADTQVRHLELIELELSQRDGALRHTAIKLIWSDVVGGR